MTHSKYPFMIKTDHIRSHLEWLSKHNIGTRRVAQLSGVGRTTITKIMTDDPKYHVDYVTVETAERLLGIRDFDFAPSALVDGSETTERIAELRKMGYGMPQIAQESGIASLRVKSLKVTAKTAEAIKILHQRVTNP